MQRFRLPEADLAFESELYNPPSSGRVKERGDKEIILPQLLQPAHERHVGPEPGDSLRELVRHAACGRPAADVLQRDDSVERVSALNSVRWLTAHDFFQKRVKPGRKWDRHLGASGRHGAQDLL